MMMTSVRLLLLSLWTLTMWSSAVLSSGGDGDATFTDQWAVHIEGGDPVANQIAQRHGFVNLGKIFGDYYHFQHRKVAKRSLEAGLEQNHQLDSDPDVRWVQQQVVKRRVKRDFIELDAPRPPRSPRDRFERPSKRAGSSPKMRSLNLYLNDPKWNQMWYLNRGMGLDMKVEEAWAEGVTGKGTVVTILDDGLEKDHPDLRRNYDPRASYDVNNHDEDPMPRYDLIDSNRHGTRCAGEVAAEGNNSICAVGVAYNAGIGGVRMLDGDVTDAVEARSLSLNPHHIDIYSASWGPDDDGKTVDGPGELATRAFIEGVTKGRNGKGSIFVWASGNGGRDHDNCNCDGYTNSIWTLSISSATENGYVPWYSEACSSTLATTYSSGSSGEKQIVTTDLHHSCTASHTGTSASAPLAAGICALALESNKNLTWRDMQHIVVRTAKPANLKADDWQVNGVGRNVSHSFGYGLMDAAAMVRLARVWNTVTPQQFCEIRAPDSNKLIPAKSKLKIQLSVRDCSGVNYIEHLQARISLAAVSRGDIQIHLSSPSGTRSTLLALRPHDSSRNGFHSWPFMSVHYWGETPFGVWTLEIHNEGRYLATLSEWNVVIYGTKDSPDGKSAETATDSAAIQQEQQQEQQQEEPQSTKKSSELALEVEPSNMKASAEEDGALNRHNSEENRRVSQPIAVVNSAAAAAGCRPGHWDSTAAVCLMCKNGVYLWQGRCLASCPIGSYAEHPNLFNGIISEACIPCHYSCLSCAGSSDSQCSSCHADAQLRSVTTAGAKGTEEQRYCQPAALVVQLESFEHWALGIELLLGVNLAVVFALAAYMICYGSAKSVCWCWRPREKSSNYHSLMSVNGREDKNAGLNQSDYVDQMAGFADESSASLLSDEKM